MVVIVSCYSMSQIVNNFDLLFQTNGHAEALKSYESEKSRKRPHSPGGSAEDTHGKKKTIQLKLTGTSGFATSSTSSKQLDNLIVQFLTDTTNPLQVVERKSFQNLLIGAQNFKGEIKVMSRRTARTKIIAKYENEKQNMKDLFAGIKFVCTTADVWSSSKRSFMGVTAHWIDSETFERRGFAIACKRFKGRHTYDKVAEILANIHSFFGLDRTKLIKTVTDNGSNMVKAFKAHAAETEPASSDFSASDAILPIPDNDPSRPSYDDMSQGEDGEAEDDDG